jgi:hypothetical protein
MAAEMVYVGCKMPNGLVLQLEREYFVDETANGVTRSVRRTQPEGKAWVVAGIAHPLNEAPKALIVNGAALTPIPKEHWLKWVKQMATLEAVTSGMVFAFDKQADSEAHALNLRDVKSGMEPVRQDGDQRIGSNRVSKADEKPI